jgi:pimeloyl-ACP methyl ester carboxylesterase
MLVSKKNSLFLFLSLVIYFSLFSICFSQNRQSQDCQLPEITIKTPENGSQNNYFPVITGTAVDKSTSDCLATGIKAVRIAIFADNQIWNGREWTNITRSIDDYGMSPSISGEAWKLSKELPQALKKSVDNSKENITAYGISAMAIDGVGNMSFTQTYIKIEPLELIVVDANKKYSGIDFSREKTFAFSQTNLDKLINFFPVNQTLNLPVFSNIENPEAVAQQAQQLIEIMMKSISAVRIGAVADGTTKLLVIARGHNPGSVTFQSSADSAQSEDCNKNPLQGLDFSSITLPDVFGGNDRILEKPLPIPVPVPAPVPNYQNEVITSVDKLKARLDNFKICTTGTKIEQDNFMYLGEYQKSENDYYWFGLYTVPKFISPEVDNSMLGQMISLTASIKPGYQRNSYSTQEQYISEIPFYLKRPPVLLVHGLNDTSASWDLENNTILQDKWFDVRLFDYEKTNGKSFDTNKLVLLGKENSDAYLPQGTGIKNASNGETTGIRDIIGEYRQMGFAISKVDVVGHSMGGILARLFYQQPEYRNDDNFNEGYIRRLITIGTPHLGSNVANIMSNDVRQYGKNGCGKLGFGLAGGEEAATDLAIGSKALLRIGKTQVLSHAITAIDKGESLRGAYYWRYLGTKECLNLFVRLPMQGMLPLGGINTNKQKDFIRSICADQPCDWTVQEVSQEGGLLKGVFSTQFQGINHGEEISSIPIREKVKALLMGNEDKFDQNGFPSVASLKYKFPPTSLEMFVSNRNEEYRVSSKIDTKNLSKLINQTNSMGTAIKQSTDAVSNKAKNTNTNSIKELQTVFDINSIEFTIPDSWQKLETNNNIAVFPNDGLKNGRITQGIIYGTIPNNEKPNVMSFLEKEMLKLNPIPVRNWIAKV